jgi:hypothetical protein
MPRPITRERPATPDVEQQIVERHQAMRAAHEKYETARTAYVRELAEALDRRETTVTSAARAIGVSKQAVGAAAAKARRCRPTPRGHVA